jgi:hypothetical protein
VSGGNGQETLTRESDPVFVRCARYLARLAAQKFYGRVTFHVESGNITVVRQEQTLKPGDLD